MITCSAPKAVTEKIAKDYQKRLEQDNERLLRKIVAAKAQLTAAPKRGRVVFKAEIGPGEMLDVDATIAIQLGLAEARKRNVGAVVTVWEEK